MKNLPECWRMARQGGRKKILSPQEEEWLCLDYCDGKSLAFLQDEYNASDATVQRVLNRNNIKRRGTKWAAAKI
jgi:hypothetical protein